MRAISFHLIGFLTLVLLVSCKEEPETPEHLKVLEGNWKVEQVTLDYTLQSDWESTQIDIQIEDDTTLRVSVRDQPFERKRIIPDQSFLKVSKIVSENHFQFFRSDEIDVSFWIHDGLLQMSLTPPRDWSYDEACPDDDRYLICSEGGEWTLSMKRE